MTRATASYFVRRATRAMSMAFCAHSAAASGDPVARAISPLKAAILLPSSQRSQAGVAKTCSHNSGHLTSAAPISPPSSSV